MLMDLVVVEIIKSYREADKVIIDSSYYLWL